jgi:hypothetical protein
VHYNKVVGVVSYLIETGHKPTKVEKNGNHWFREEAWWTSKSEICLLNDIALFVDNEVKYAEYFLFHPTTFSLFRKLANNQILLFHLEQCPNVE